MIVAKLKLISLLVVILLFIVSNTSKAQDSFMLDGFFCLSSGDLQIIMDKESVCQIDKDYSLKMAEANHLLEVELLKNEMDRTMLESNAKQNALIKSNKKLANELESVVHPAWWIVGGIVIGSLATFGIVSITK